MPFRDMSTACGGDTLAQRYEDTMVRLECMVQARYVEVKWECEFELPAHMKMEEHLPPRTRDALYGGRTGAMRLHYKLKEDEETIQYVDEMSLYSWVCKYFKFPFGHPTIHVDCEDLLPCSEKDSLGAWCCIHRTCITVCFHTC
jgi:hypothetical protein